MLTDAEVGEWNERWRERGQGRPLRNLTPEQWRGIAAMLPEKITPTKLLWFDFLIAANFYWIDAERPAPRERARLISEAEQDLNKLIEKIDIADPIIDLTPLAHFRGKLEWRAKILRDLAAYRGPTSVSSASHHRQQFVADAVELWKACGGQLKFSRSPDGPIGPLIRYLECVCKIVMGDNAPAPETLAAFINRELKGD